MPQSRQGAPQWRPSRSPRRSKRRYLRRPSPSLLLRPTVRSAQRSTLRPARPERRSTLSSVDLTCRASAQRRPGSRCIRDKAGAICARAARLPTCDGSWCLMIQPRQPTCRRQKKSLSPGRARIRLRREEERHRLGLPRPGLRQALREWSEVYLRRSACQQFV
jgi:hypothetical protein